MAGILDRDGEKFVLSPEADIVFGPEKNAANMSGLFGELPGIRARSHSDGPAL